MLYLLYSVTFFSSIFMLLSRNPINSVLFLILVFLSSSNIFFFIGCDFLGLIFIIVYLGAIAVLFFFIVMVVNIRRVYSDTTTYLLIGFFFFFILLIQIWYVFLNIFGYDIFFINKNGNLFFFDTIVKLDSFSKKEYFSYLGRILYLDYFFYIVVVSILLLIGMVGSIFLTNYRSSFSSRKQYNQFSRNNKLINLHTF